MIPRSVIVNILCCGRRGLVLCRLHTRLAPAATAASERFSTKYICILHYVYDVRLRMERAQNLSFTRRSAELYVRISLRRSMCKGMWLVSRGSVAFLAGAALMSG